MTPEANRRRYLAVPPPPPLRPFVECLWAHAVPGPAPGDDRRILPDGRIDLVWIRELGLVVAGPQSRHTRRPVAAPMVAFGARFHPGVAPALLRLPASELVDEHVPLAAIDSALAARLETRLGFAGDPLAALEAEMLRALRGLPEPDPVTSAAVRLLGSGSAGVADVAAQVYGSERQLQRRFAERIGYGPKTFQRIMRFQRVAGELRRGSSRSTAWRRPPRCRSSRPPFVVRLKRREAPRRSKEER